MNLTPEQIEQNGEAIKAHQRGEKVDYNENGIWEKAGSTPLWRFSEALYRPAPKPEPPKPWDMDTCPKLPFEVLRKDKQIRTIVDFVTISEVGIGYRGVLSYRELLDGYTLTDGSPCGSTP